MRVREFLIYGFEIWRFFRNFARNNLRSRGADA